MQAFAILVNNVFLDIGDSVLRYELVNPMFITELYQDAYSFPFTIPASELNIKALNYANYLDNSNRNTEYDAWLYIYGVPKFKCKLRITKSNTRTITVSLYSGIKALTNADKKLSEIDLGEDYFLGNTQDEILATAKTATQSGNWQAYPFAFVPFAAPNFYNGNNPNWGGVVNRVDPTTGNIWPIPALGFYNKYTYVPWLFLFYVLYRIFKAENLTIQGSFWTDPEMSKLLLVNNKSLDERTKSKDAFMMMNGTQQFTTTGQKLKFKVAPGMYDSLGGYNPSNDTFTFKAIGDYVITVELIYRAHVDTGTQPSVAHGGSFSIKYDGTDIGNSEGLSTEKETTKLFSTFVGYSQKRRVVFDARVTIGSGDIGKSFVLYYNKGTGNLQSNTILDVYNGVNIDGATYDTLLTVRCENNPQVQPSKTIKFGEHVGDFTVAGFLSELKKIGLTYDFDYTKGTVTIDKNDSRVTSSNILELTDKSAEDIELSFENSGKGLTLAYEFPAEENAKPNIAKDKVLGEFEDPAYFASPRKDGDYIISSSTRELYKSRVDATYGMMWEKAGYWYPDFVYGKGETSVVCKLAPVQMCIADNEGGSSNQNKALMPYIAGVGTSPIYGVGVNDFALRLVFWRGLNNDGVADTKRGGNYVLASTGMYNINRQKVGNYTFNLETEEGLLRATSERMYTVLTKAEQVEANVYANPADLHSVTAASKVSLKYNTFIPKSFSILINRATAKIKAVMYKI